MNKNVRAAEDPWTAEVDTGRHGQDGGGDRHRGAASATSRARAYVAVGFCGRTARVRSLVTSASRPVPCIHPIFVGLLAAGVVSPDCMPQQTRKPQATSGTCSDQSLTRVTSNVLMLIRSTKHKLTA